MNVTDKKFIQGIRNSQFKKLSEMFLYTNRISYVNLRLFQEYHKKSLSDPDFEKYAEDSLIDASFYLDRSVKILLQIKADALKLSPVVKSAASLNNDNIRGQVMKGVEAYVRIEKDWEALFKMADALERTGSEPGPDQETARQDILNLVKDIVAYCDKAITIFRAVQNKILDELGA